MKSAVEVARPFFPAGGPGFREVLPGLGTSAVAMAALAVALPSAPHPFGASTAGLALQAGLVATAMVVLLLDLLWVRLNQRIAYPPRLLARMFVAVIGAGFSVWCFAEGLELPTPIPELLAVGTAGWWGWWRGRTEFHNRLTSSVVPPRHRRDAVTLERASRRLLRREKSLSSKFWLDLNLAYGVMGRVEGQEDEEAYRAHSEVRSLIYGALDRADAAGIPPHLREDVLVVALEAARALDLTVIGGKRDSAGHFIDELLDRADELAATSGLAAGGGGPNAMVSRVAWIRAERMGGILFAEVAAMDPLQIMDRQPELSGRWAEVLPVAERSLEFATARQAPDAAFLVLTVALFNAQSEASADGWAALLRRIEELGPTAGRTEDGAAMVRQIRSEALVGRARTEPTTADRIDRLGSARQAVSAMVVAAEDPVERAGHLRQLAEAEVAQAQLSGDPEVAGAGIAHLREAVTITATYLLKIGATTQLLTAVRSVLEQFDDGSAGAEVDRWRWAAAAAIDEVVTAARQAAALGTVRNEIQGPMALVSDQAQFGAELLLELDQPGPALVLAERGRLIALGSVLSADRLDNIVAAQGHSELARERRELAQRLTDLEAALAQPGGPGHEPGVTAPGTGIARGVLAEQARQTRSALESAVRRISELTGERPAPELDWAAIQAAAAAAPLLYLIPGEVSGYGVLVRPADPPTVIRLPKFSVYPPGSPSDPEPVGVWEIATAFRDAQETMSGTGHNSSIRWRRTLDQTLEWLEHSLAEPLRAHLAPFAQVVVVACGQAGQLPVHAVLAGRGEQAPLVVRYAAGVRALRPDAAEALKNLPMLAVSASVAWDRPEDVLLTADALADLACRGFQDGPGTPPVRLRSSSRAQALAALPGRRVVHFSCHGVADDADPLAGGLELADARLTVADVLGLKLRSARLAVVAACESGQVASALPDEQNGLATGLIEAGFAGVIAALWEVEERPAYFLLARFYDRLALNPDRPPAQVFAEAQNWLRRATIGELGDYPYPGPEEPRQCGDPQLVADWPAYPDPDSWAAYSYFGV